LFQLVAVIAAATCGRNMIPYSVGLSAHASFAMKIAPAAGKVTSPISRSTPLTWTTEF
jgi:hypothetical protein